MVAVAPSATSPRAAVVAHDHHFLGVRGVDTHLLHHAVCDGEHRSAIRCGQVDPTVPVEAFTVAFQRPWTKSGTDGQVRVVRRATAVEWAIGPVPGARDEAAGAVVGVDATAQGPIGGVEVVERANVLLKQLHCGGGGQQQRQQQ